jgi:predicted anti-sigma-YlaC factor YlaD
MIRRGLTCREVVERATEYFEACLPSEQSERFAAHVAHCEGCQAYLRQLRITLDLTRTLADREPLVPPTLLSAFREWRRLGDADRDDR